MIGNQIIRIQVIDSTNNYANQQIKEYEYPEGTVFLAYEQTAGRGQVKNFWESEPGKNLTFSIVVYPTFLEIRDQFLISKVVTLGIYKALSKYIEEIKIKWPNDIYAGSRKLGGILIENSIMYSSLKSSVIGIGLNINQTVFRSSAPNPVSLKELTNQQFDLDVILKEILAGIDFWFNMLKNGEDELINLEFVQKLYWLNEKHFFKSGEESFEGEIIGLNKIGQLLIQKSDGTVLDFHFKEVEFLNKNLKD